MRRELKPRVVGRFDLIKLLAAEPCQDPKRRGNDWRKIVRNLAFIVEYGGLLEINSSGLRKGLGEPYPGRSICEVSLSEAHIIVLLTSSIGDH
jgi:histidinol-phosphatase (PHP family)